MNLLKSFKVIICAVLICTMFSGCMNSLHLKDLTVVEGMGIDRTEKETLVTARTLNVEKTAGSSEASEGNMTVNAEGSGDTIVDAVASVSKNLSKELFFGQNKLIIFSRDIAENDFKNKIDYFLRSDDSRSDVSVCISNTKAKDILETKENESKVPCENILHLMKKDEESGSSAYVTTGELIKFYTDKTSDIYLPVLEKDKKTQNVKAVGIGIFDEDRLVYTLDEEETMGFLIISGRAENCTLEFEDEKFGKIGVRISGIKTKNEVQIKDGDIIFSTQIKTGYIISEIQNGIVNSLDAEKLNEISVMTESKLISLCEKSFKACQENNSDCMRVGNYLAKCSSEAYNSVSDKWDDYYKSVKYSVSAQCKLKKISDNAQFN